MTTDPQAFSENQNTLVSLTMYRDMLKKELAEVEEDLKAQRATRREHLTQGKLPIHVTDHAVVRYLERVIGLDIAQVRRDMAEVAAKYVAIRPSHIKVGKDYTMAMDGHKILTVLPHKTFMTKTTIKRMTGEK